MASGSRNLNAATPPEDFGSLVFVGMLMHSWWIFGVAPGASLVATIVWLWPEARLGQTMDIVHA